MQMSTRDEMGWRGWADSERASGKMQIRRGREEGGISDQGGQRALWSSSASTAAQSLGQFGSGTSCGGRDVIV